MGAWLGSALDLGKLRERAVIWALAFMTVWVLELEGILGDLGRFLDHPVY